MDLAWWEELMRLLIAGALGAAVGFDREVKNRPAGLRTMTLVAMGAAGFVLMSIHALAELDNLDLGRVLSGIAGGVGFIGAGVIIQSRGHIRGVTTAASVWVVAAVGASAALGAYALAALITGLTVFVLWPMKQVEENNIPKKEEQGEDEGDDENG